MIGRERFEGGGEVADLIVRRADPETPAVILQQIDAGATVRRVTMTFIAPLGARTSRNARSPASGSGK